jgi:hypothetical protein
MSFSPIYRHLMITFNKYNILQNFGSLYIKYTYTFLINNFFKNILMFLF